MTEKYWRRDSRIPTNGIIKNDETVRGDTTSAYRKCPISKLVVALFAVAVFAGLCACSRAGESAEVPIEETTTQLKATSTSSSTLPQSTTTTSMSAPPSTRASQPPKFAGSDFQGLANWGNAIGVYERDNPYYRLPLTEAKIVEWINFRASSQATSKTALTATNCLSINSMDEFNKEELKNGWEITYARQLSGNGFSQPKQYAINYSLGKIYFICGEKAARDVALKRPNCPQMEVLGKMYPIGEPNCDPGKIQDGLDRWTDFEFETAISTFLPYRTKQ